MSAQTVSSDGCLFSLSPPPRSLVTLYNCSMGREDCSLCKNADPKYRCVWCTSRKSCVYEKLCSENPQDTECPDPQISDVSLTAVLHYLPW